VDDSLRVSLGQSLGDLNRESDVLVECRASGHLLLQRLARVVGHGDERPTVGGFVDIENDADVGVIEGRGGLSLADKALVLLCAHA